MSAHSHVRRTRRNVRAAIILGERTGTNSFVNMCVYLRECPVRGTPPALPLATGEALTLGLATSSESF
jgi:hypothetical protein